MHIHFTKINYLLIELLKSSGSGKKRERKNIYYFSYVHKTIIEYYLKNKKVNLL